MQPSNPPTTHAPSAASCDDIARGGCVARPLRRLLTLTALTTTGLGALLLGPTLPWSAGASIPNTPVNAGHAERDSTDHVELMGTGNIGLLQSGRLGRAQANPYAPGKVIVQYRTGTALSAYATTARIASAGEPQVIASHTRLLRLKPGVSVTSALVKLRARHDVLRAMPDYIAHSAEAGSEAPLTPLIPNDEGEGTVPGGWEAMQWNFVGTFGVGAPLAWAQVAADGAPGGHGVVVAVLDTGVAYANRGVYRRSPDFEAWQFVKGYDFIDHDPYPNDRNGHGTFVAGTIAETTGNHIGLTGLAYDAKIMPVRVLNANGEGEASTIAEGVRFAVKHGAKVINLSLEFSAEVNASDIPELIDAIHYAIHHGVLVVAAAGNEGSETIPYPARQKGVVAVGATTEHGCLANYSNYGPGITLVAPGGGPDAELAGDPNCHPTLPPGRDVYQETFTGSSPSVFGFPPGYEGTSMATPHVSATAALIIASGILGAHPTPAQLTARMLDTATKLGGPSDQNDYGAGLLNASAATAPGGPGAIVSVRRSRTPPAQD